MASRLVQEERVRRLISELLGQQLEKKRSRVDHDPQDYRRVDHEYDGLSDPPMYALEVKTNVVKCTEKEEARGRTQDCRGRFDTAIKQVVITDLFWLSLSGADRKILAVTNPRLFELIHHEIAPCLPCDTFVLLITETLQPNATLNVERWTSSQGHGDGFPDAEFRDTSAETIPPQ